MWVNWLYKTVMMSMVLKKKRKDMVKYIKNNL